jgi:hypothetical protein
MRESLALRGDTKENNCLQQFSDKKTFFGRLTPLTWLSFLGAFAGGILGAAIGGQPAFILVGWLVLAGVASASSGGGTGVLDNVAFGPIFGPHVCFAGGAAAAAFAARKRLMKNARDLATPLMGLGRPDILLMGGLFGIGGHLLNTLLAQAGAVPWTDTVALCVVISGFAARVAFARAGFLGTVPSPAGRRFHADEQYNWLPWQQTSLQIAVIGLAMGTGSGYLARVLGADKGGGVLCFGIAASLLVFMQAGFKMPVTHHIALPAALAVTLSSSILVGIAAGIAGGLIAELFARAALIHSDTYIDPPAVGIVVMTTLLRVLTAAGTFGYVQLP